MLVACTGTHTPHTWRAEAGKVSCTLSQSQEVPSPHLLQWLGSRVAHLVDKKVLPLLEGLPTFITDVIAYLCVDELHMSLQVSVDHEYLVAARVWAGPFPDLLMVLLDVLLGKKRHENLVFHLNTSCLPGDPA